MLSLPSRRELQNCTFQVDSEEVLAYCCNMFFASIVCPDCVCVSIVCYDCVFVNIVCSDCVSVLLVRRCRQVASCITREELHLGKTLICVTTPSRGYLSHMC